MIVGVISDTHGLLRPQALDALLGSQYILHAGDIGTREIISTLETIAPVTAIRGNVDRERWTKQFKDTEVVELAGLDFYILHDLNALDLNPKSAGFAAVISGHSHRPRQEVRDGVLYFNPGSAGPRRFRLPITVGRLEIADGKLSSRIIELSV